MGRKSKKTQKEKTKQLIVIDRIETYKDFVVNLFNYLFKYYIDDGSFSKEDNEKFFQWCYNNVCNEFKKEDIDFTTNKKLFDYLKEHVDITFFYPENGKRKNQDSVMEFWNTVFDIDSLEKESYFRVFLEIYTIFDKTFEKPKIRKQKKREEAKLMSDK